MFCGIGPNWITVAGVLVTFMVPIEMIQEKWIAAGLWLLIAGFFDVLDGALARFIGKNGKKRTFGAFWDSTLDRVSEAIVFSGFLLYYSRYQKTPELLLAFTACILSLLVSYTRARAEGLGIDCEVGILPRPGRVVLLATGLVVGWPTEVLALVALLSGVTVVQRVYWVYRKTA